MKLINVAFVLGAHAERIRRDACEVNDSPFQTVCAYNKEETACTKARACCWDGNACNAAVATEADVAEMEGCTLGDEGVRDIGSCLLNDANFTANLAERKELDESEQKLLTTTMGKLKENDDGSDEGKSGFIEFMALKMMTGQQSGPTSLINPATMGVTQLINSKYYTCPINIPHCQRIACQGEPGSNLQTNANACFAIPGCCFDTKVYQYKYMFGEQSLVAPTCYKAIRTPLFHYFANQLSTNGVFVPNFLTFITSKVEAFIENDQMFDFLAQQHRCLSTNGMTPQRVNLERYIASAWPGYTLYRVMNSINGGDFLGRLADTLSTQCGWKDVTMQECMMIGCCFNKDTQFCSNPTDITKIPQQELGQIIQHLMMSGMLEETVEEKETEEPPKSNTGTLPANTGQIPPPGRNTATGGSKLTTGQLPTGQHSGFLNSLRGRRKRKRRSMLFADIHGPSHMPPHNNDEARMGMMTPQMAALMASGQGGNPALAALMANSGGAGMMGGTGMAGSMGGMGMSQNPLNALIGQMGQMGNSLFGGAQQNTCASTYKLDCTPPPEELDFNTMWKMQQKCKIKGCCWDTAKAQQMTMKNKLQGFESIIAAQCPYSNIAKIQGMPDLTDDVRGCCDFSPCVHVAPIADWTSWGEWSTCSAKCGGGKMVRSRSCEGKGFCPGMHGDQREQVIEQGCNTMMCEAWAEWSAFTVCSTTCGRGEQTRSRSCWSYRENREIAAGAAGCRGFAMDTKPCEQDACPRWLNWSTWSVCSASCGLGRRIRNRSCTKLHRCQGDSQQIDTCGSSCWLNWSSWSSCTATCLGGTQNRSRECNYVAEVGEDCIGTSYETKQCASNYCETWLNWGMWSTCAGAPDQVCGAGQRSRHRACTGMIGQPGCKGSTVDQGVCDMGACTWSEWSQSSVCVTLRPGCGIGSATYQRTCNGGPGACPGQPTQSKVCELAPCPGFSAWSEWTDCSVTCGHGTKSRSRTCNGQLNIDCVGSTNHKMGCNNGACSQGGFNYNTGNTLYGNTGANQYGNTGANQYGNTGANQYGYNNFGNVPKPTTASPQSNNLYGGFFGNLFGTSGNNFFQPQSANSLYTSNSNTNTNPFEFLGRKKK